MKYFWLIFPLLMFALCSCEKPQPVTYAPPTTEESSSEPDLRPRAPMHLDRTIRIIDYPMQIRVPERWDIRYGTIPMLQGPTPNGPKPDGVIHLTLSRHPVPSIVLSTIKPPATNPTTRDGYYLDEIRNIGKMQVREQRSLEPPVNGLPAMINWSIRGYVSIDKDTIRFYQIKFLDLTRDHFDKDRALLESMIASLSTPDDEPPSLR